jgi:hypothetical protein
MDDGMTSDHLVVDRRDLAKTSVIQLPADPTGALAAGSVLLRIKRFAFTANNVTYALTGGCFGY